MGRTKRPPQPLTEIEMSLHAYLRQRQAQEPDGILPRIPVTEQQENLNLPDISKSRIRSAWNRLERTGLIAVVGRCPHCSAKRRQAVDLATAR